MSRPRKSAETPQACEVVCREREVAEIYRLANKGVNVVLAGDPDVGKTAVLNAVYERFANGRHTGRKLAFFRSYGNKRDIDESLFAASFHHGDVVVPDLKEQNYEGHCKGNLAELERRVISAVQSSEEPYLFFVDGMDKVEKSGFTFFRKLLDTGKVSIVATCRKKSFEGANVKDLFSTFDRINLRPLNDQAVGVLVDHMVEEHDIEVTEEDLAEIKRKLPRVVAGRPGAIVQKFQRALKERRLDVRALIEDFPIAPGKFVYAGWMSAGLFGCALGYRYFLRVTGDPADLVMGGIIMAAALIFFRVLKGAS
ncbi:MAG: ATP-binding protein [Chloroflexi bacterium]|nr:ATP-binding protein [Chloroflexota bacterium]